MGPTISINSQRTFPMVIFGSELVPFLFFSSCFFLHHWWDINASSCFFCLHLLNAGIMDVPPLSVLLIIVIKIDFPQTQLSLHFAITGSSFCSFPLSPSQLDCFGDSKFSLWCWTLQPGPAPALQFFLGHLCLPESELGAKRGFHLWPFSFCAFKQYRVLPGPTQGEVPWNPKVRFLSFLPLSLLSFPEFWERCNGSYLSSSPCPASVSPLAGECVGPSPESHAWCPGGWQAGHASRSWPELLQHSLKQSLCFLLTLSCVTR